MATTIHDVLRAIVGGESAKLNNVGWVADALEGIDKHEADSAPAPAPAPAPGPEQGPPPAPGPVFGGSL